MKPTTKPPRLKPIIDVKQGDLSAVADLAWSALKGANSPPTLFQHECGIAEIDLQPVGGPRVQPVTEDRLRHVLVRTALWRKPDKGGNLTVTARPPFDLVKDLLARRDPPLPFLKGIRTCPYFMENGSLHVQPGYSPDSQLFYAPPIGFEPPSIPRNPSRLAICHAKAVLLEPLADFPFASDAERTNAVGLMLLPFVEQFIDGPLPAHVIDKPVRGSGGGLLTDVLLWPALGSSVAKMTEGGDEEDWRKRVTAGLLHGSFVMCIDNVIRPIRSAALASALTEKWVQDRILGHSRIVHLDARRLWIFVGNNVQLSSEIARRTIRVRLNPAVEHPETRTGFRHPHLRQWVNEHRGVLVQAILTLCQAWLVAGRPAAADLPTLGSFEAWSQVIGGILAFAGIPGFLANIADVRETVDAASQAFEVLIDLWWKEHGDAEIGINRLWEMLAIFNEDVLDGLDLGDGREAARRSRLGLRVRENRDRIFNGRRLELIGSAHGANLWRLMPVP
jgi:putative DNA primase/helicase